MDKNKQGLGKRRVLIRAGMIAVAGLIAAAAWYAIPPIRLVFPQAFGMHEAAGNIYVDPGMTPQKRQQFLSVLNMARKRLEAFYGDVRSRPVIVACATWRCYERYGGTTPKPETPKNKRPKGAAYGQFIIRLSPDGLNEHIVTHELAHIELHTRLGVWRSWWSLPAWFDEGLAVLISRDPRYTRETWRQIEASGKKLPQVRTLFSQRDWMRAMGGGDPIYAVAHNDVAIWYATAGREGLLRLIARMQAGESFDTVFTGKGNVQHDR